MLNEYITMIKMCRRIDLTKGVMHLLLLYDQLSKALWPKHSHLVRQSTREVRLYCDRELRERETDESNIFIYVNLKRQTVFHLVSNNWELFYVYTLQCFPVSMRNLHISYIWTSRLLVNLILSRLSSMASLYQVTALKDWWWLSYVEWWAISRVEKKACIDIQHGFGIAIGSVCVLLFSGLAFIIPVWAFNLGIILDSVRHSLVMASHKCRDSSSTWVWTCWMPLHCRNMYRAWGSPERLAQLGASVYLSGSVGGTNILVS